MKVCAYCRVSTDSADQTNSFENQQSLFQHAVTERGQELVAIYADKGISGTKLKRPEFERMLFDAGINVIDVAPSARTKTTQRHTVYEVATDRKPLFNSIWVKNFSRFARNILSFELIQKLLVAGVGVYSIEQNIDTRNSDQIMLLHIFQTFDEQESRDKSQKTRTGVLEAARKGALRASGRLYGYHYIKGKNSLTNKLEAIPEEAEVVKKIFTMYADGQGIRRIIGALTEQGIFTREGKPFAKTTIRHILDNEKYAGINNILKYDTGMILKDKHSPRRKDEYRIERSERIEPIITEELFYKCQEVMHGKVNYQTNKGIYTGVTKYAGLLYCGKCGAKYVGNTDRGRHFYNCQTKRTRGKTCTGRNVQMREVDELFTQLEQRPGITAKVIQMQAETASAVLMERLKEKLEALETRDARTDTIRTELETVKRKRRGTEDLFIMAEDETQRREYQQRTKELQTKEARLRAELEEVNRPYNERMQEIDQIMQLQQKLAKASLREQGTEIEYMENKLAGRGQDTSKALTVEDVEKIIVDAEAPTKEALKEMRRTFQEEPLTFGRFTIHVKMFSEVEAIAGKEWREAQHNISIVEAMQIHKKAYEALQEWTQQQEQ